MRITLTRTGGVGGVGMNATLDAAALPAAERAELERLVAAAGLWTSPARLLAPARAPDRFRYQLRIEEGPRRREIRVAEEVLPEPLRELVRWVEARAAPAPAGGA